MKTTASENAAEIRTVERALVEATWEMVDYREERIAMLTRKLAKLRAR